MQNNVQISHSRCKIWEINTFGKSGFESWKFFTLLHYSAFVQFPLVWVRGGGGFILFQEGRAVQKELAREIWSFLGKLSALLCDVNRTLHELMAFGEDRSSPDYFVKDSFAFSKLSCVMRKNNFCTCKMNLAVCYACIRLNDTRPVAINELSHCKKSWSFVFIQSSWHERRVNICCYKFLKHSKRFVLC